MATCELEVQVKDGWKKVVELKPGDRPGSLSGVNGDGEREITTFECAPDGSKTIIHKDGSGADLELGTGESYKVEVISCHGAKVTARLTHKPLRNFG